MDIEPNGPCETLRYGTFLNPMQPKKCNRWLSIWYWQEIGFNFIETGKIWSIWLGIVVIILMPIWMIIEVEKELKKRFPKN